MAYPNTERFDPFVREARSLLEADGIPVERVSGGGTAGMFQAHTYRELTEHRAGEYVYGDRRHLLAGRMSMDTLAARVVTTVISRPTAERGILDGGSKTLSSDLLGLDGHGLIVEYPDARIYTLSEEHAHVDFSACARKPDIGERVSIIPNHICVVTNLFNQVHAVRRGAVEDVWPVAARGALQ
jgi:D-serine deaminase-like pyridoxal phosphate-dependent protein